MLYKFEPGKPLNDKIDFIPFDIVLEPGQEITTQFAGGQWPSSTVTIFGIECEFSENGVLLTDNIVTDNAGLTSSIEVNFRINDDVEISPIRRSFTCVINAPFVSVFWYDPLVGSAMNLYVPHDFDIESTARAMHAFDPDRYYDFEDVTFSGSTLYGAFPYAGIDGYITYNMGPSNYPYIDPIYGGTRYRSNEISFGAMAAAGFKSATTISLRPNYNTVAVASKIVPVVKEECLIVAPVVTLDTLHPDGRVSATIVSPELDLATGLTLIYNTWEQLDTIVANLAEGDGYFLDRRNMPTQADWDQFVADHGGDFN